RRGGRGVRGRASRGAHVRKAPARPRRSRGFWPAPRRGHVMSESFLSRGSRVKRESTARDLRGDGLPSGQDPTAGAPSAAAEGGIRDFVGLAETAWDFNKPGGAPGFGPLRAIDDVQRLAAQVASVLPTAAPQTTAAEDAEASERSAQAAPASLPQDVTAPS